MVRLHHDRLWLSLPAVALCAVDGCLTLWGQPEAYWSGGYATVREGNPIAVILLAVHPLAFAASAVPYLAVVVGAIVVLPRHWAAVVATGVALAHSVGAAAWCWKLFPESLVPLGVLACIMPGLGLVAWRARLAGESRLKTTECKRASAHQALSDASIPSPLVGEG